MEPAESTVEKRNQTHSVGVAINRPKRKILSAHSLTKRAVALGGKFCFWREGTKEEVIVPPEGIDWNKIDEIAKRGEEIYEADLKINLEGTHWGKFVLINVDTSEHVIADTQLEALKKFDERFLDAPGHCIQIGVPLVV